MIGMTGLLSGALLYLFNRPPDHIYFIKKIGVDIFAPHTRYALFDVLANNFPSFIHVFSIILITVGLLSCQKSRYLPVCLAWFLIDSLFELGQRFGRSYADIIPESLHGIPFLENSKNFFLKGTFDYMDMAAIAFGAVTAYLVLLTFQRKGGKES